VVKAFLVHNIGGFAAALARAAVHHVGFAGIELGYLLGKLVVVHVQVARLGYVASHAFDGRAHIQHFRGGLG
jgi:hypothetical protein